MPDYRPLVIRLRDAEWDLSASEKLRLLLSAATDRPRVYIDMSAVTYMDAACLGKLACMQRDRLGKPACSPAVLIVADSQVRGLLRLVGFEDAWPIFGTLEAALSRDATHDDLTFTTAV